MAVAVRFPCMEGSGTNYINVLVTGLDKVAVAVRWSL